MIQVQGLGTPRCTFLQFGVLIPLENVIAEPSLPKYECRHVRLKTFLIFVNHNNHIIIFYIRFDFTCNFS